MLAVAFEALNVS